TFDKLIYQSSKLKPTSPKWRPSLSRATALVPRSTRGTISARRRRSSFSKSSASRKASFLWMTSREVGHNCESGFVWILQKKKKEHTFNKLNQTVSYDTEVTAFVEKGKMKKVTGVKIEDLSLVEVYVDESSADKVTIKTDTGLSDTHDAAVFALGE
uniref:Uncharacterized protein n=1 Tax=Triticum urartu TaxID=4572 RepID=A0A8R7UHY7_TRIUA